MTTAGKIKIYKSNTSSSRTMAIPHSIVKGDEATYAGGRLLIIDPRGEISEDDLVEFLEDYIEPKFWRWMALRRAKELEIRRLDSFSEVASG